MRIVLDTNVVISRYISPHSAPARIFDLWEERRFDVLVSEAILIEYEDVFLRPSIQRRTGMGANEVGHIIVNIADLAIWVQTVPLVMAVSLDPDDDVFLECAVAGDADYVVSGDKHLLQLDVFEGIPIVTPSNFVHMLERAGQP